MIIVSTGSALLGAAMVLMLLKIKPEIFSLWVHPHKSPTPAENDFVNPHDLFEVMTRFRERMEKQIENFDNENENISDSFDSWLNTTSGGGVIDDIMRREDEKFVYYDITVKNLEAASINTKIEDGYITITGKVEKTSFGRDDEDNPNSQTFYSSTFNRTFPLPDNVDSSKMEMTSEEGQKVILKFPKK